MRIYTYEGQYLSGKPLVVVAVVLPDGAPMKRLEQSWPADDEPDVDGRPPSEVLPLLEKRLAQAWISTGRARSAATHEWCKQRMKRLDAMWAETRIASMEKTIEQLTANLKRMNNDYVESEECDSCHELGPAAEAPVTEADWMHEAKYHKPDCEWLAKAKVLTDAVPVAVDEVNL